MPADLERGFFRRTDQHYFGPHHLTYRARQVRVMGTPEQERIDPGGHNGREQPFCQGSRLVAPGLAALDEFDEARARCACELDRRADAASERL